MLASGLARRDWEVRVLTRARDLRFFRVTRSPNLTVLAIPGFKFRRLGTIFFLAVAIPVGILWGRQASVFMAVQLVAPSTAAALCARIVRRPFLAVATTSGRCSEAAYLLEQHLPLRGEWSARAYRVDKELRRLLLRRAALVLAQTTEAADELGQVLSSDRIVVVPTPVETVTVPPLTGSPQALFTGRFSRDKDLLRLLRVWREVVMECPEAKLTLAGAGGLHEPVEREIRAVVAEHPLLMQSVKLTGWVSDVTPFLADSDVFVFPSLTEGMSNALLEACAWGRVVVASDIAANRAVLGDDYPLLFPAGDEEALMTALLRAFRHQPTREAARGRVLQRATAFSIDAVLTAVEELMEMVMAGVVAGDLRQGETAVDHCPNR